MNYVFEWERLDVVVDNSKNLAVKETSGQSRQGVLLGKSDNCQGGDGSTLIDMIVMQIMQAFESD